MNNRSAARRRTLHIAFFSGDITRSGGTERVATWLAGALTEAFDASCCRQGAHGTRTRISIVSLFEERAAPAFPIDARIRRFTLYPAAAHGIWRYFATVRRLFTLVRQQHIDVLIDIDGILDMYALPVKRLAGVKVISWEHFNCLTNPDVPYRKLTRRWASRRADAIVTLTGIDRTLYERRFTPRCPVTTIANPMPVVIPAPVYGDSSRLILSAGRLTRQKGFDLLVDVAARVLPKHPDWRWMILGEGEERMLLERRIAETGLDGRLILAGRTDDMDGWMRRADMFVLTSRYEGLPMVLLEAKAHWLPIVAFDCPTGPSDIVADNVNGRLIAGLSVPGMANAMEPLMNDAALRREFSQHAQDGAERFDESMILTQWMSLLHDVAAYGGKE
ncbi:glycosyltransferase family 4 protein [Bifidobacterium scaligerum]|uniref:glycosyltransferase family 4 protein n=1 Tax=Bifidobacterium scaligerum TaxID=2052656 RepID=UPI001FAF9504|nr:glycosyltransferase family 4 protein [Bifidobacterium scaligerum]